MNHLLSFVDQTMERTEVFEQLTGWNALVDFPTRGESRLDNCLSNRAELFGRCRPFIMLSKSDHTSLVSWCYQQEQSLVQFGGKSRSVTRESTVSRICTKR